MAGQTSTFTQNKKRFRRNGEVLSLFVVDARTMNNRVSQKNQKSEFWNATYPSGFHRLDEPPNYAKYAKYSYLGAYLGARNMVKWGVPEKIL